jgi:hypothetical protein
MLTHRGWLWPKPGETVSDCLGEEDPTEYKKGRGDTFKVHFSPPLKTFVVLPIVDQMYWSL